MEDSIDEKNHEVFENNSITDNINNSGINDEGVTVVQSSILKNTEEEAANFVLESKTPVSSSSVLASQNQIDPNKGDVDEKSSFLSPPSCSQDQSPIAETSGSLTKKQSIEELETIRSENTEVISRLSNFAPPYTSFSDYMQELAVEISIEKATNLQLGFMKKATLVNLIQISILNIFEVLCEPTKENGEVLKTILKIFNSEYFEFIIKHLNSVFKRAKPILDEYFANENRELSHSFLKSLFFDTVTMKNAVNFNVVNERKKLKDDAAAVFAHLFDVSTKETLQKAFAEFIYSSIERAIEQRCIVVAYTILYLFNAINYIIFVLEKDIRQRKITKPSFLPATVSGILISNTQHVVRYLFNPQDKFEILLPLESAYIIQSNEMSQKIQDPHKLSQILKRLTERNPSQESQKPSSSSSTFFSSFFG